MPFRRQTRKRCRRGASPLTRRLILPGLAALQPALLPHVVFESSLRERIDWLIFQLQDLFIGGAGGPISSYLLRPLRKSGEEAQDAHPAQPSGARAAASRPDGGRSADRQWRRAISIPFHVLLVVGATGFPPVSRADALRWAELSFPPGR